MPAGPTVVESIRNGDESALRSLYREYRQPFIKWMRSEYSCSEDDAADIFQASVVVLYDNIISGKLQHLDKGLKEYLLGIGRLKGYEWLRMCQKENAGVKNLISHYPLNLN